MIAQATRAVRLAAATVTTRTGLRCSSAGSRGSTEVGVAFAADQRGHADHEQATQVAVAHA